LITSRISPFIFEWSSMSDAILRMLREKDLQVWMGAAARGAGQQEAEARGRGQGSPRVLGCEGGGRAAAAFQWR
jgi:hypothetical protein